MSAFTKKEFSMLQVLVEQKIHQIVATKEPQLRVKEFQELLTKVHQRYQSTPATATASAEKGKMNESANRPVYAA